MPPADCLLCSAREEAAPLMGWPRMLWVPYSEVDRAKTLLVVPGRALRGVALGGGGGRGWLVEAGAGLDGEVGRVRVGRLGTDRGGRLAAGRAVVPGQRIVIGNQVLRERSFYQEQLPAFEQGQDRGQLREQSVTEKLTMMMIQID